MKLSLINFNYYNNTSNKIFAEGYARVYSHDYTGDQVTDPRPTAVSLGRWRSPKGNQLFAGLNMNYLSDEQISRLQQHLPTILKDRNLKRRVRKLRSLAPDIFHASYRTYKKDEMNNVSPGVLRFAKPLKPAADEVDPDEIEKAPAARTSLADKIKARHEKEPEILEPQKPEELEEPEKAQEETQEETPEEAPEEEGQQEIEPEEGEAI